MDEVEQLATAMMVVVFAAVMIVGGHLYMENQARKPPIPGAQIASMQTLPPADAK
jgi:hypothetical protein